MSEKKVISIEKVEMWLKAPKKFTKELLLRVQEMFIEFYGITSTKLARTDIK